MLVQSCVNLIKHRDISLALSRKLWIQRVEIDFFKKVKKEKVVRLFAEKTTFFRLNWKNKKKTYVSAKVYFSRQKHSRRTGTLSLIKRLLFRTSARSCQLWNHLPVNVLLPSTLSFNLFWTAKAAQWLSAKPFQLLIKLSSRGKTFLRMNSGRLTF